MKKIPSLFARDHRVASGTPSYVRDEIVPGSEWVSHGEGVATRKHDGTACLVRNGVLHRRYDAKHGKPPPPAFMPAQDPDPITGHWPGWLIVGEEPESKWHREAWAASGVLPDGTYELCGPKISANPERVSGHVFIRHGSVVLDDAPRTFAALRAYLYARPWMEGIVWHHADGRMVKIKRRDFEPLATATATAGVP